MHPPQWPFHKDGMQQSIKKQKFVCFIIKTALISPYPHQPAYRVHYVLDLYLFGYGSILLEKLNQSHEIVAGTMPSHSIEKYKLYMYIGALYNTAVIWLGNGTKENTEDIARMFCGTCNIPYYTNSYSDSNIESTML